MAEKIVIELDLKTDRVKDDLKQVSNDAKRSGQNAGNKFGKAFGAKLRETANTAAKDFLKIAVAVTALNKALNLLGSSFNNLRGFRGAVAEINSILPKNAKLTEESTQKLIEFSAQYGKSQQAQAKAFYNIVSAGVKGTSKQLETLRVANTAAVAGLVDIDTAAKVLVSSVNAYSKSGLTAKQASDSLFTAVREGQTTFRELSDTVGKVTSIAASAGLEFSELAGFLAFSTKSGLNTSSAVAGLRQVLSSLIKPTSEAREEAKRIGLEFSSAALKSKGLARFLVDLIN